MMNGKVPPHPPAAVLAVLAVWNVCLFAILGRHGRLSRWMVAIDVSLAIVLLALAAESGQDEWAYQAVLSAAALAGGALSLMPAALVVSALGAAFIAETLVRKDGHVSPVVLAGDLSLVLLFAAVVGSAAYTMRMYSRHADRAASAPPALVRDLHDTALATLSAIAGGRVDHRSEQVRRRAAQDVAHIRRLILSESAGGETPLDAASGMSWPWPSCLGSGFTGRAAWTPPTFPRRQWPRWRTPPVRHSTMWQRTPGPQSAG